MVKVVQSVTYDIISGNGDDQSMNHSVTLHLVMTDGKIDHTESKGVIRVPGRGFTIESVDDIFCIHEDLEDIFKTLRGLNLIPVNPSTGGR